MKRSIERVISPRPIHFVGDGFRVQNFIPSTHGLDMKRMDPFIFLDYNEPHFFEPTATPRGVDVHPHRGFETVTVAFQGKVAHHDSAGNSGIVSPGGVQWMTAASGVLHKEYHEEGFARAGGIFHMAQLWVNLPAKNKMDPPSYQGLDSEDIPSVSLSQGGQLHVIAGEFHGVKGGATTHSPMHLYRLELPQGASVDLQLPRHYNTAFLVLSGSVHVLDLEEAHAPEGHFVLMDNDGTDFSIQAEQNAHILLLSGEPLNEPIAASGPFVMNHRHELQEAMQDFYAGKFGQLD